jgi:hypothetical protein
MKPDAYDLGNEILTMWQRAAIMQNDASEIKKRHKEIPLFVESAGELKQVINITFDQKIGIILHVQQDNDML